MHGTLLHIVGVLCLIINYYLVTWFSVLLTFALTPRNLNSGEDQSRLLYPPPFAAKTWGSTFDIALISTAA